MDVKGISSLNASLLVAFRSRLRQATTTNVAVRRKLGEGGDELRADLVADLKDALTGDEPSLEMIEVPGEAEPQLCITTEGLYRVVLAEFGLDRTDQRLQETVWEWVRRDIDEVLASIGSNAPD